MSNAENNPSGHENNNYVIIIVLWKYRLNLSRWSRRENLKIVVVAPPRMIIDESMIDIYYQVEPPIRDHDHCMLTHKVREVCSLFSFSECRLLAFETALQIPIATIRRDMDVKGFQPDRVLQMMHSEHSILPRTTTLRQCSLSGTPNPDSWVEAVKSQIGGFPAIIRPIRHHCAHSVGFVRDEEEFKSWFRRNSNVNRNEQYLVQQYLKNGFEFSAICSMTLGFLGCITTVNTDKTVLEYIQSFEPYVLEILTADQTRNILPGLESFTHQVIKSTFSSGYYGIVFVKGYYKNHNDIYYLGCNLEPDSDTTRQLISMQQSDSWETLLVKSQMEHIFQPHQQDNSSYHCVLNFPCTEGVLIHQSTINKVRSQVRVAWRSAEGAEIRDSDHIDDNVLQVFAWNSSRSQLHEDSREIILKTNITMDKTALNERHNVCRRNIARLHAKELVRSCTTAD